MEEARKKIEELRALMDKDDAQSQERRNEIAIWFKEHHTPEAEDILKQFLEDGVTDIAVELQDIRRQIADEDYRLLPISYIANKYFGKSHSWLSQRINGTKVRGRVYTLNAEQKDIFNQAMQDLSEFYGSFRLT